jgi:hypothetical protein
MLTISETGDAGSLTLRIVRRRWSQNFSSMLQVVEEDRFIHTLRNPNDPNLVNDSRQQAGPRLQGFKLKPRRAPQAPTQIIITMRV